MPLPDRDFEPTEAAVPWKLLTQAGHEVIVATERGGAPPAADPVQLEGIVAGRFGTSAKAKAFYRELAQSAEFTSPVAWDAVGPETFDGLLLAGGHAPGMKQYLGSETVQAQAAAFMRAGKPVAAVCHGVLVLARAGALREHRTTCFPKYLERIAAAGTFWKPGYKVRTYSEYVEDEVRAALADPEGQFERGPLIRPGGPGWALADGNYVSARWYGDAYVFARRFLELL
jgi:putative intracellular protease/amidase